MHQSIFLLLLIILAACSAGPSEPTAVPASPPPIAAEPTAAPIGPAEPTASRPAEPLPAPLYTLDQGQIFRIERDGLTRTRLTDERTKIAAFPPIATFAVSAAGALAYVVGDLETDRLVITGPDGADPVVRYSEQDHELSDLAWSPDGATLAFRLLNNRQPPDIPSGIYRIDRAEGSPELLVADDPVEDLANPSPDVAAYRPFAWAPDGTGILVEVYSPFYFTCGFGVLPAEGGAVARVALPADTESYCGEADWAPDSASVLFMAGPENGPTIWRYTLADGSAAPLGSNVGLARAPLACPDGATRLVAIEMDATTGPLFTLAEFVEPAASLRILSPAIAERPLFVLWGATGEGAVMLLESAEGQVSLRWLPTNSSDSVSLPATRTGVTELRWGGD